MIPLQKVNRVFPGRWLWLLAMAVWNALFIAPMLGPIMHESDQASLIEGALRIARDGEIWKVAHYNYDKQFGTYWILAGIYRTAGFVKEPDGILWIANAASLIALNAALWFVGRRVEAPAARVGLLAGLFSPALLIHGPFVAGNFFAAMFIAIQSLCLAERTRPILAGVCAFAAVACRADALLVQPLLIWTFQNDARVRAFFRNPSLWWCLAGTVSAMVLGRLLLPSGFDDPGGWKPSFKPKILIGYSVFGLGGFAFVLLGAFALLVWSGWKARPFGPIYALCGIAALALPFCYYALHLFSTRYWTVPIFAVLALLSSRRTAEVLKSLSPPSIVNIAGFSLVVLATFVPLVIGVSLPILHKPSFTLTAPTLLPSADGLIPMGAYLARAWGWDRPERLIPDHNEAIWRAALQADYGPDTGSPVLLAGSPLETTLKLALYLRGREVKSVASLPVEITTSLFADLRSFRKAPIEGYASYSPHPLNKRSSAEYGLKAVSPEIQGELIVVVVPGRTELRDQIDLLRGEMRGNDFQTHALKSDGDEGSRLNFPFEGRRVVLLSKDPFEIVQSGVASRPKEVTVGALQTKYYLYSNAALSSDALFRGKECTVAVSSLPSYMNVESY